MEQEPGSKIMSMIQELQKQVGYLEKKIDALIAQGAGRSGGQRSYSAPSRSYGAGTHQRYASPRPRGNSFESKHTSSSGQSYDKKRDDERSRYTEKKRPFRPGDKDRSVKGPRKFYPGSTTDKNR